MIPNKAKNVLLIPLKDGGVTQYFNMPGFPSYNKAKAKHNGIDIGWCDHEYCDILACQDGKVMQVRNNDSSIGNAIVLQHDYEDRTHRWTAYIHLKDAPTLKPGDQAKQGTKIGVRGGSPYGAYRKNAKGEREWYYVKDSTTNQKYGTHLHLYVSAVTDKEYTWDTMKKLVVDPYPLLYRSKAIEYDHINSTLNCKPFIEDVIPEVVNPVERDESVNQLSESTAKLRVRMEPNLKANIIGLLKADAFYNFYDVAFADGYEWYEIADGQWCAQTGTMTIFPKADDLQSLRNELQAINDKADRLESQNNELMKRIDAIRVIVTEE